MTEINKRLVRLHDAMGMTGLSKASIYKKEKKGEFPSRVSLGARSVAWYEHEIQEWVCNRPKVSSNSHPKAVVSLSAMASSY